MTRSISEIASITRKKVECDTAYKALISEENRIRRDFNNIQDVRTGVAKRTTLEKLNEILLKQFSYKLSESGLEIVTNMHIDNGWNLQILDGSENMLMGLHSFCNSITLSQAGAPILSVTHLPMYGETIVCEESLQVINSVGCGKRQVSLKQALDDITCVSDTFFENLPTRSLNANMFTIVLTALGRLDAFILKLPQWQTEIARFYINQAGGKISTIGPFCIGSNVMIHESLRNIVFSKLSHE